MWTIFSRNSNSKYSEHFYFQMSAIEICQNTAVRKESPKLAEKYECKWKQRGNSKRGITTRDRRTVSSGQPWFPRSNAYICTLTQCYKWAGPDPEVSAIWHRECPTWVSLSVTKVKAWNSPVILQELVPVPVARTGRLYPVVLVLPAIDAAAEWILPQVVALHWRVPPSLRHSRFRISAASPWNVVHYVVLLVCWRGRGPFRTLLVLALGARRPDFADEFADRLADDVSVFGFWRWFRCETGALVAFFIHWGWGTWWRCVVGRRRVVRRRFVLRFIVAIPENQIKN